MSATGACSTRCGSGPRRPGRTSPTTSCVSILPAPVRPEWQTQLRLAISEAAAAGARSCAEVIESLAALGASPSAARPPGRSRCTARPASPASGSATRGAELPAVGDAAGGLASDPQPHPAAGRHGPLRAARGGAHQPRRAAPARRLRAAAQPPPTPTRHSVLAMDEAWALTSDGQGRALLERISRLGRSQNITPILATQMLGDAAELEPLVGALFAFGVETEAEARRRWRCCASTPTTSRSSSACSATGAGAATCATSTARWRRCRSTRPPGCSTSSTPRRARRAEAAEARAGAAADARAAYAVRPPRRWRARSSLGAGWSPRSPGRSPAMGPPGRRRGPVGAPARAGQQPASSRAAARSANAACDAGGARPTERSARSPPRPPPSSSAPAARSTRSPGLGIRNPACDRPGEIRDRATRIGCRTSGTPEGLYPASNYGFDVFIDTGIDAPDRRPSSRASS